MASKSKAKSKKKAGRKKAKSKKPSSTPGAKTPAGSTTPCPKAKTGGIKWEKQPGATDDDLKKAQQQWDDAKKRRLPDGRKPDTVKSMEALERSKKTTTIKVGGSGNEAGPTNGDWAAAADPKKGTAATITFNPNKKGTLEGGVERDPESSLAHEAFHAREISQGKLTSGPDLRKNAEVGATAAENQHRAAKGLDQRKKYGTWDVPEYTPPPAKK